MDKKIIGEIPLWQFRQLVGENNIIHFVSGREGGKSKGDKGSLNLSYCVGDLAENVRYNRDKLAKTIGAPDGKLIFPQQTHSNNVKVVDASADVDTLTATDALITSTPGICLAVLAADCVPILAFDTKRKAIAAIHSGWRGTIGRILSNTIILMQEHYQSKVENVKICIGPSIGPMVYEVGEEVEEAVHEAFPDHATSLLHPLKKKGKARFNLWEANKQQAVALGIPENNIEIASICTYSNPDQFFSARRALQGGRFAAGIMLVSSERMRE